MSKHDRTLSYANAIAYLLYVSLMLAALAMIGHV